MFSILLTERGGAQRQLDFHASELNIGRIDDNDVVLPRSNVSKHHACLVVQGDRSVLTDLNSTNGTYVNGRKITSPAVIHPGDKIYIGDYILTVQDTGTANAQVPRERLSTQPLPQPSQVRPPSLAPRPQVPPAPAAQVAQLLSASRADATVAAPRPVAPAVAPMIRDTTPAAAPNSVSARPEPAPALHPRGECDEPNSPVGSSALLRAPSFEERPTEEQATRFHGTGSSISHVSSVPPRLQDSEGGPGAMTSPAVLAPSVRLQGALQTLMERLAQHLDLADRRERAFPSEHQQTLEKLIDTLAQEGQIGPEIDRRFLQQAAISEAVGLGPLDRLLNNRAVREVVVDNPARILADLGGGLSPVSSFFSSPHAVQVVLRRLCARAGSELSDAAVQQFQLPDGSQLHVLLPPLSASGPLFSIRCPARSATSAEGLVTEGVLSVDMLGLLRAAVQRKLNVLIVGPIGTGVSTLLGAIASMASDHERIVTMQHAPSLSIQHPHVLSLSLAGLQGTSLMEVLRHAERLRADRWVIDDLHGEDALGALMGAAAMRGVLVGMHAPSPAAALEQLELFAQVSLGGARGSLAALIAQAFHVLVHVTADPSGARRVQSIAEVRGARDNTLDVAALYRYDGGFKATEQRALFLEHRTG